ncbi:hypothetical protein O6H91_Y343700 [Diphasiastrum complanatum]|nr:hypothetical protein O6H91_Y343700 [Diphasiastrum complanatum]
MNHVHISLSSLYESCRVPDSFSNGDKLSKLCEDGRLKEALQMLELMVQQTTKPPIHAYVCRLKGCSRRKALAEGKQVHALIVQSVLDSNRNHGHAEIGRRAFDRVVKLEPKNAAPYVLSNIYLAAGRKDELAKIRNEMKEAGVKKMPGCSWIEVDNQLHAFVVGDATHPQSNEIQAEVDRLVGLMRRHGINLIYALCWMMWRMRRRRMLCVDIVRSWPLLLGSSTRLLRHLFPSKRIFGSAVTVTMPQRSSQKLSGVTSV